MTQNGKVETGLPSLFPLQYSAAIMRLEHIFLLSADLILFNTQWNESYYSSPQIFKSIPILLLSSSFFITSFITGFKSQLSFCSQFKTRSYPSARLFVDFGSYSACGYCSLPSDHRKQARTCWCSNNTCSALWGIFFPFWKYTNMTKKA